jgi:hypothetical protein
MHEIGIDISRQYSKSLRQFLGRLTAHFVIFVCVPAEPACPRYWPGSLRQLSWPFDDPAAVEGNEEAKLAKFRSVRDQIDGTIRRWLEEIEVSSDWRPPRLSQLFSTTVAAGPINPLAPPCSQGTSFPDDVIPTGTVLTFVGKTVGYTLLGGIIGSALGVPISWGAGMLLGNTDGAVADGLLLGAVLGSLTGAAMSDPIDSWPRRRKTTRPDNSSN